MRPETDVRTWRPWMDNVAHWFAMLVVTAGIIALIAFWLGWDQSQADARAECERNGGRVHTTSTRYYSWTCIPGPPR